MPLRQRLLIGAIGGITPVVLNLLVVDMVRTLTDLTVLVVTAYLVKVCAMSIAGSLSAWLHEDEMKAVKLFQLGMVAPALLTSLLNGAAVRATVTDPVTVPAATAARAPAGALLWTETPLLAAAAWPQGCSGGCGIAANPPATPLTYPEESASAQIARGLFGVQTDRRDCLVQVATASEGTTAETLITAYRHTYPVLPFRLFSPGAGIRAWLVTIGGLLTRHEADQIQQTLVAQPHMPVVSVRQLPPPTAAQ